MKDESWESWKRIKHSMELEGWKISNEFLKDVAKNYNESEAEEILDKIVKVSKETGRPISLVAKELMGAFWNKP